MTIVWLRHSTLRLLIAVLLTLAAMNLAIEPTITSIATATTLSLLAVLAAVKTAGRRTWPTSAAMAR